MDGLPPLPHSPSPMVPDLAVNTEPHPPLRTYAGHNKPPHSPVDTVMAHTPAQKPKGQVKPSTTSSGGVELSVFDILNIFHRRWFLLRSHLLTNVISAQKAEDRNISWVEFLPPYHAHLVKHYCACASPCAHGQGEKGDVCICFGAAKAAQLPPHEWECLTCG